MNFLLIELLSLEKFWYVLFLIELYLCFGRAVSVAAPVGIVIWIFANLNINGISILSHVALFLDPFAKLMGLDNVCGTVEEGKSADMIVMSKNPLDDLTALRDLDKVIVRGEVIDKPLPKRNETIEKELDDITKKI